MRVLVGFLISSGMALGGGLVVEGLVGAVVVAFEPPVFDEQLGFVEGVEGFHVEQFSSQVTVERFGRLLPDVA